MASSSIDKLLQSEAAWHTLAVEETAQRLRTDATHGLSYGEAKHRYAHDGPNALLAAKGPSGVSIFLHQFRSLIVLLLLAAGGVALALGENVEALAILIVIVLNAVIGFLTEWKAEAALDALRKQMFLHLRLFQRSSASRMSCSSNAPRPRSVIA